jgi:hypothetical protein
MGRKARIQTTETAVGAKVLTVAEVRSLGQTIDWGLAPLVDAVKDLTIKVSNSDILQGQSNPFACPVFNALRGMDIGYAWVGKNVVHIAARLKSGAYGVIRYRSGTFPKQFDQARKDMLRDGSLNFEAYGIKSGTYVLPKASESQTKEGRARMAKNRQKLIDKGLHVVTPRKVAKRTGVITDGAVWVRSRSVKLPVTIVTT